MAVSSISQTSNYYTQAAAAGQVGIATALAAIKANPRTKVSISDSTENIARNLDSLRKVANNITQVAQSDPGTAIEVTAGQWAQLGTLLSKFTTNYQLQVSNVAAANAATVAGNSHVAQFAVLDTSANISAQLAALNNKSKLTGIAVSNPATNIGVTAAQLTNQADALGKLRGNYGLAVTQATSEQAVGYAGNLRIKSVAILDSAAGVSAKLDDLKALGLRLKEIRSNDTNVFSVTADQLRTDALVIGKIYKGFQLSVLGASMEQAQSLVTNKKVVSVDIEDTAANLAKNLGLLDRLGSDLHSIHITDTDNPLTMSSVAFGKYASLLGKILPDDDFKLSITDATADEAQTLLNNARVSSISVADNSAAIAARLNALELNSKVTDIRQTGKPGALAVTWSQLTDNAGALAKIRGNYNLSVSGVAAGNALSLALGNSRITSLTVSDTGDAITRNLNDLAALGKRLTRITQSNDTTALNLSVSQWSNHIGTLSKISGGYSLALSGVSAAKAQTLASDSRVASLSVSDSASAISAQLDNLHGMGTQLTGITQTDTGTAISVTASQWATQSNTLAKLGESYTLAVRNASASQISTLAADSKITSVDIIDSSSHIAEQLDTLQDVLEAQPELAIRIRQTGQASPMTITSTQLTRNAQALDLIAGNYSLAVSDVTTADATQVGSHAKVASMTVSDTAANLSADLAQLAALGAKVRRIEQSDSGNTLELSATAWAVHKSVIDKIDGGVRVALSEVKAAGAQALLADGRVESVSVADSAAQISANLDMLQELGPLLTGIEQSDSGASIGVSMGQLTNAASTLEKISGDYTLAVNGATAQDAQNLIDDDNSHVQSIAVADTSVNIAAQIDNLQANSKLTRITQIGTASPLSLSREQFASSADALAKISGSYSVAIRDALATDVASLNANSKVARMAVEDSASNIIAALGALQSAGSKVSDIRLQDAPATLEMSHSQWVVSQSTLAKISQNYSVQVHGVSAALAASVASDPRVASLAVSDSTASINANLGALQRLGPQLNTITPTESGTPPAMTLTAAQRAAYASALEKITGGRYTLQVTAANVNDAQALLSDSKVTRISVADSSDNIASHLAELNANSKLSAIVQTGTPETLTVNADLYAASSATLAKFSQAYTLQINDASVASAANLQSSSHVSGFTVTDTSSQINAQLASLAGYGKLGTITLTQDNGPITLSQTQLDSLADTLARVQGGMRLQVTGVTMDNLDAIAQTPGVSLIELTASSQEVSENFDSLINLANTLIRVDLSDLNTPIALTHDQYLQGSSTLAKVQGNYQLALVDVKAENATLLSGLTHVDTVSVADTASNLGARFDELLALGDKVDTVEITDDEPVFLSAVQASAGTSLLAKFVGNFSTEISS